MKFLINPVTQFEQNCSLVICEQTNQSAFIDPGGDVDKLIEVLETSNSNLSKILITHGHIDHCGIASDLHKKLSVPITFNQTSDKIEIKTEFNIILDDFKIKIPRLLFQNIAEDIDVKVESTFIKYKGQ